MKENMPERIAETYEMMVGVCNSLNALSGLYLRNGEPYDKVAVASILLRAQDTIMKLIDETGRGEEFKNWCNEHSLAQSTNEYIEQKAQQ